MPYHVFGVRIPSVYFDSANTSNQPVMMVYFNIDVVVSYHLTLRVVLAGWFVIAHITTHVECRAIHSLSGIYKFLFF